MREVKSYKKYIHKLPLSILAYLLKEKEKKCLWSFSSFGLLKFLTSKWAFYLSYKSLIIMQNSLHTAG